MTDSALSPFARDASVVLEVRDAEIAGFRTEAAAMALCHGLAVGMLMAETSRLPKVGRKATRPLSL